MQLQDSRCLVCLLYWYKGTNTDTVCLFYCYKSTNADAEGAARCAVCLLYWYKITNADEEGAGRAGRARIAQLVC